MMSFRVLAFLLVLLLPLASYGGWFDSGDGKATCIDLNNGLTHDASLNVDGLTEKVKNMVVGALKTTDGKVYEKLVFTELSRFAITFHESSSEDCRFELEFISQVERKNNTSFQVTLINGKSFLASVYKNKDWLVHPFVYDTSLVLDQKRNYEAMRVGSWYKQLNNLSLQKVALAENANEKIAAANSAEVQKQKQAAEEDRAQAPVRLAQQDKRVEEETKVLQSEVAFLMQQDEAFQRARIGRVKVAGQKVCTDVHGTEKVYTGFQVLGQPQYRTEPRLFTVNGTTEKSIESRIQIRVESIMSNFGGNVGQPKFLNELSGNPSYQVSQLVWVNGSQWRPCN